MYKVLLIPTYQVRRTAWLRTGHQQQYKYNLLYHVRLAKNWTPETPAAAAAAAAARKTAAPTVTQTPVYREAPEQTPPSPHRGNK